MTKITIQHESGQVTLMMDYNSLVMWVFSYNSSSVVTLPQLEIQVNMHCCIKLFHYNLQETRGIPSTF